MPLDRAFLSLLSQSAVLTRNTGTDQWGNDTYGSPETIACFYAEESKSAGGDEDESEGRTEPRPRTEGSIITDAVGIEVSDRITPPGGVPHEVTQVDTAFDESGVRLYQTSTLVRES